VAFACRELADGRRIPTGHFTPGRRPGAGGGVVSGSGGGDLLPTPELRAERERARWWLHLVKHRAILKNRVHSSLIAFGHQVAMADLFGVAGRRLLAELDFPEP